MQQQTAVYLTERRFGFWGSPPISAFVFCPPFGFECWAPVIREEFDPGREEWEIDKAKAFGRTHDWNLTGQYRRMVTLEYPAYLVDFTRREEMRITKEEEESQSGSKVGTCALLAPQSAIFPSLSSRERFIQRWLLSVPRWCSWLGGTPQINSSDEGGAKPEKICRMDWCPDSPRGVQFLFLAIFLWMRCVLIWIKAMCMVFLFGFEASAYISVRSPSSCLNKKVDLQEGLTATPMMQWALS